MLKKNLRSLFTFASFTLVSCSACFADFNWSSFEKEFIDKPCRSYSHYLKDGKDVSPSWSEFKPIDFGSRQITFDTSGARPFNQIPPPGVHPRVYFTAEDLPDIRKRLKETRCGQEVWKNILSWTEMMKGNYDDKSSYAQPDTYKGSFGLHGRVPLFRLNVPSKSGLERYNHNSNAAEIWKELVEGTARDFPPYYWGAMSMEAFRCLVENDEEGGKKAASAVCTAMKIDQAKRDAKAVASDKSYSDVPDEPVGKFHLSFCYDFLYNWMTPGQKTAIHDELARSTWIHDNYGTFNDAEGSRSNWATFSYRLYEVLAIEGEPGFNVLKVRGIYKGWRNLLSYGWFTSGATYEGEAKNQLGMDGIFLFTMRQKAYGFDNLCGHPYLRAYADKFLPHSSNAMLTGFHKYDLLGGSHAGINGSSPDALGLKFVFPNDKTIDWMYRLSVGEDYSHIPDVPDLGGYSNPLLFYAVYATDFDPGNSDPAKLGLGNTFFCGERALMMTRSSWDTNATQLNMHVRQANGGHPFADRNALMVAGAGRIWSPNGYASFKTSENSVVCIDDKTQMVSTPGRLQDFVDNPLATFAVGDAKYCWDWNLQKVNTGLQFVTVEDVKAGKLKIPKGAEPENHTINDFAYTKLPFDYLNRPLYYSPDWIFPAGAITPLVRTPNYPVQKAFRTAGLVRGAHPYIMCVDDIQKDDTPHRYDWILTLERDIQIVSVTKKPDATMDILLTGNDPLQTGKPDKESDPDHLAPDGKVPQQQPMLLVRVLNAEGLGAPRIDLPADRKDKVNPTVRRLVIPTESIAPAYKILLYAHKNGDPLPTSSWDKSRSQIRIEFPNQMDTVTFSPGAKGLTHLTIARAGETRPLIELVKEPTNLE